MKQNNTFKRVAAGALAAISVAGYTVPANVGGFLNNTNILMANAEEAETYTTALGFAKDLRNSLESIKLTVKKDYGQITETTYDGDRLDDLCSGAGNASIPNGVQGSTVTIKSYIPLVFKNGVDATLPGTIDGIGITGANVYYKTGLEMIKSGVVNTHQVYIAKTPLNEGSYPSTIKREASEYTLYKEDGNVANNAAEAKYLAINDADFKVYSVKYVANKGSQEADVLDALGLVNIGTSYYEKASDAEVIDAAKANAGNGFDKAYTKATYGLTDAQKKKLVSDSKITANGVVLFALPDFEEGSANGADNGYTYTFNMPKADKADLAGTAGVTFAATGTVNLNLYTAAKTITGTTTEIWNLNDGNLTDDFWDTAVSNDSSKVQEITKLDSDQTIDIHGGLVKTEGKVNENIFNNAQAVDGFADMSIAKDADGADTDPTKSNFIAYNGEPIILTSNKKFGVWAWDGKNNSGVVYKEAAYDETGATGYKKQFVLKLNVPYAGDATKTQLIVTKSVANITYTKNADGTAIVADGEGFNGRDVVGIKAYVPNSEVSTEKDYIATTKSVKNASVVTLEIDQINELLEQDNTYGSFTLTKNKDHLATQKEIKGTFADPKTTTFLQQIKNKDTNHDIINADGKITGAGHYDLTLNFNVREKGQVVSKTVNYSFDIETKAPLTADLFQLTATDKSGKSILKQDDGTAVGTVNRNGSAYGPVQFLVTSKYARESVQVAITGYATTVDVNKAEVKAKLPQQADGTAQPFNFYRVDNAALINQTDSVQKIKVRFTDPEFGADEQTVEIPYMLSSKKAPTAEWVGIVPDGADYKASNPLIKISKDTLDELEDRIFDNVMLNDIEEDEVKFEYSLGAGKRYTLVELDKRSQGLPTEVGTYTVFLTYKGNAFFSIDVQLAEHTMYFVPSDAALNPTYGDESTLKYDYTTEDFNGKAVNAILSNVNTKIYRAAVDEMGRPITDEYGNPRIANALGKTVNTKSPFFVTKQNAPDTFYTYDATKAKNNPEYEVKNGGTTFDLMGYQRALPAAKEAAKAAQQQFNEADFEAAFKANFRDFNADGAAKYGTEINAGTYIVVTSGDVDKNTGYVVEDKTFVYTVSPRTLTEEMVLITPAEYERGVQKNIAMDGSQLLEDVDPEAHVYVADKYKDMGLQLVISGGTKQETEAGSYNLSLAVPSDNTPVSRKLNRNFSGTIDTHWNIIKKAASENFAELKIDDTKTTIGSKARITTVVNRSADGTFIGNKKDVNIQSFGVVYDGDGKIPAPKYSNLEEYKKLNFKFNSAGVYADTAIQTAYEALKLDNGFERTGKTNTDSQHKVALGTKDVETGMWVRPYVLLSDGTVYYGEVKYVNLQEEATKHLNLKLGDQNSAIRTNSKTTALTYADAKTQLKITEKKITSLTDKNKVRDLVQSGYDPKSNTYFAYGSYTLADDSPVKTSAIKNFGIIVDDLGLFDVPTKSGNDADYYGKNNQKKNVKEGLKIGKGDFYTGHSNPENPVYNIDEYGIKYKPTSSVTGVWMRGYVTLDAGELGELEVYTDPVYMTSVSEYYSDIAPTVGVNYDANGTLNPNGATKGKYVINVNAALTGKNIPGLKSSDGIPELGVVVDETGSLLNKGNNVYANDYFLRRLEDRNTEYNQVVANSQLILDKNYKEGCKYDVAMTSTNQFCIDPVKDADRDDIPVLARPYIKLNIYNQEVTIYGKFKANAGGLHTAATANGSDDITTDGYKYNTKVAAGNDGV